jgi:hypothetical protein
MGPGNTNIQRKFGGSFRAEPKKAVALAVLLTVLAVMIGRFVLSGNRPSSAKATASRSTRSTAMSGKNGEILPGPRVNSTVAALLKWGEAPVPPVSRNLFTVRSEYFPQDGSRTTPSEPGNEGFWQKLEKSLAVQADLRFKHDTLVENFKTQASGLKLQSIVMGPQPTAMVNGQMVAEGSVVAGFRVLKIEARRMIIEREGIRLEIQMK